MLGIDLVIPDVTSEREFRQGQRIFLSQCRSRGSYRCDPICSAMSMFNIAAKPTMKLLEYKLREHNMLTKSKKKKKYGQHINLGCFGRIY